MVECWFTKQVAVGSSPVAVNKSVWLNRLVSVYRIGSFQFEFRCCHLNFRYRACYEQGVP